MIDQGAGAAGAGRAAGHREPAGHPHERVHRRGGRRVLLQVRHGLPGRGRVPDGADPARRLHDQDHAGPQRDGEDEGVAERRGARGRSRTSPNVMAIVAPGQDQHRVLAMGSSRTFGLDAGKQETSYGLPYEPVNLGAGSVYKIFTTATALQKGLGINYQMTVPPSGYASPIYVDGNGRPIPVANAGQLPGPAVDHRRAGPVAEHRVHQARGVHRRPGRGGHGRAAGHEVAGDHPVRRPEHRAAHRPVDRRGHQGPEAGLVHPRGEPDQRAGAVQRRRDPGRRAASGARRSPIESVTDAERPAGAGHRGRRATRPSSRAWRTRC